MMVGDGPDGQPTEGVTLDGIVGLMDDDTGATLDESEESEDSDESEVVEDEAEESAEADEDEETAEEATFTIKHDGKEVTLKQSEVLEMAQQGFDYTKKTMAVAEERKAIEPIRKQAEDFRQRQQAATDEAIARLEAYSKVIERDMGEPPPITLAQTNASHYLALKAQHEARTGQFHQALNEIRTLKEQSHQQRQATLNEKAEFTLKALADTPGWSEGELAGLHSYIAERGFHPDKHGEAFVEFGLWDMARKAKAFDALQADKAKLKPVQKAPPKVHKPGGNNQPPQLARHQRQQEAMKAHDAKPSLNSLAALLD